MQVAAHRQPRAFEGSPAGLRFLVCAFCATEWHLVRIKCASCASTEGIAYFEIEGTGGLVKAETCDQCRTYSKIVFAEKKADAGVFADDLATPRAGHTGR
jgi:FdhE protein